MQRERRKNREIIVRSCRILIDEPGSIYRKGKFVVKQDDFDFGYNFTHLWFARGKEGTCIVRARYLERKVLQAWLQAARAGKLTRDLVRKLAGCVDRDLRGATTLTLVRILSALDDIEDTGPDKPGRLVLAPEVARVPKDMRKVLERLTYAAEKEASKQKTQKTDRGGCEGT